MASRPVPAVQAANRIAMGAVALGIVAVAGIGFKVHDSFETETPSEPQPAGSVSTPTTGATSSATPSATTSPGSSPTVEPNPNYTSPSSGATHTPVPPAPSNPTGGS